MSIPPDLHLLNRVTEAAERYAADDNMLEFSGYKLDSCRDINHALRSQTNHKSRSLFMDPFRRSNPAIPALTRSFNNRNPIGTAVATVEDEFSVEVHVEKSVTRSVCHDPEAYEREDYRQHRVMWDEATIPTTM